MNEMINRCNLTIDVRERYTAPACVQRVDQSNCVVKKQMNFKNQFGHSINSNKNCIIWMLQAYPEFCVLRPCSIQFACILSSDHSRSAFPDNIDNSILPLYT